MTIRDSASPTTVRVTVFHGPSVRDRRGELRTGLADLSLLSAAAFRPLAELDEADTPRPALVFSDRPPAEPLPERPTVWVTTDAAVAAEVADAAAVVHWGFDDDWEMLEARLDDALARELPDTNPNRGTPVRALDRLGSAVLALDTEHRFTYLNESAAGLFDATPSDLVGGRIWEHAPPAVTSNLRPAVEQALSADDVVMTEVELDDGVPLFEVAVYPGPDGVTLYSDDPDTSSRPSLYEYLVETVGDAVYILDDEGRFVFVNDALCEMTGYERDELLGSSVHIIKDEETVTEAEDALRDLLRTRGGGADGADGIEIAKLDVELVRKDDERVPCTDRMTLRPLEDGEFTGTVGTLRDISRQRRRQNLLNGIIERSRTMMTATDTETVAEVVVSTAVDVFDLDLAALRKYDPDADGLVPVATSAAADEVLGDRPVYDTGEGPAGTAFVEGELVVTDSLAEDAGSDVSAVDNGAYLPIGDQYVLSLGHGDDDELDDVTLGLLEVFGETAAAAIDRVHREEHLRQYEAIVEAAEEMLFTVDDEQRFTLVTRPFARMLGFDREELVGRHFEDFLPAEDARHTLSSDGRVVRETEFEGAAGPVPCRLSLTPFQGGFVGSVRDISQLRSAQREASRQRRRFVELFETLSDPVADVRYENGVATVESINPAFAALCDSGTDALQHSRFETAQEAMPAALADALDPVHSPAPSLETTATAQTPAGERHYLVRTAPYESDGTDRAFVLLTDVTEVKRRGTHLKVLHRLLRHNLRNETALIKGHAEQLRQLSLPAGADDHIDQILDASDELVSASETSRTVQRVLGFDADDVDPLPAAEALERLRTDLDRQLSAPDTIVTVRADTDDSVPFSQYLLVALRELVANAVEHDPASAVEVRATDDSAGGVSLTVSDDGDGIPEPQWNLLTGEREITQLQHGDGLGLWLVKWVTDRHGGRLHLDEADSDGTTISLRFPAPDRL